MIKGLLKLIGAEKGEKDQVLLLLGNGFFMGIFLATYQVAAESTFIFTFEGEYLEQAFIISGLLGMIFTGIFGRLQSRWPFDRIAILNALFIIVITGLIWFSMINGVTNEVAFTTFVLMGPLTALVLLSFWGVFGRIFNLRQSKRIIGGIDTGQLLATILAFYTIPLFTRFIGKTEHLFLLSSLSLLVGFVFLLIIVKRYNIHTYEKRSKEELKEVGIANILKNNYIVILAIFLIFSVVAFKFVDFAFLKTVQLRYDDETKLANFLGPFNGTIMILSFLIQTFLNDKIIGDYGLKVALLVMPVILAFFTLAIVFVGSIFGITPEAAGFGIFFLLISLSKLFITSLKDALESPAFKLFFLPFDTKVRFDIQAKIEGVVGQFSTLIAGGLTLLLTFLGFQLLAFSYFLLLILGGLIYVVFRLYKEYKNELTKKLTVLSGAGETIERKEDSVSSIIKESFQSENESEVISTLLVADKLQPLLLDKSIASFLKHPAQKVRQVALKLIMDSNSIANKGNVEAALDAESDSTIKEMYRTVLSNLAKFDNISFEEVRKLANSPNPSLRILGAKVLRHNFHDQGVSELSNLVRDQEAEVKEAALVTIGARKDTLLWQGLIDSLKSEGTGFVAFNSIVEVGEDILPSLETAFYKSGQQREILYKIIRAFGEIGGDKVIDLLLNKLDHPEPAVVNEVLYSLNKCGFQVKETFRSRFKNEIGQNIGKIVWNLAAYQEIKKGRLGKYLRQSLREENAINYDHIYMVLMMLYDYKSVLLVQESVQSGSGDDLSFAVELLDIFIEEDLKPTLLPAIDDLADSERLKRLEIFFPRASYDEYTILRQIINRDYNNVNLWTKACAIECSAKMPEAKVTDDLIANLFNPSALLRETTAWAVYSIDPAQYHRHIQRLPAEDKKQMDLQIESIENETTISMFDQILFLKNVPLFANLSGNVLIDLMAKFRMIKRVKDTTIIEKGEYAGSPIFIIGSGEVKITNDAGDTKNLSKGEIFGNELMDDFSSDDFTAISVQNVELYRIKKNDFLEISSEHSTMVENILKSRMANTVLEV